MDAKKKECTEIEITPEMIEAGARVIEDQCEIGLRSTAASIARVTFEAMIDRRPRSVASNR